MLLSSVVSEEKVLDDRRMIMQCSIEQIDDKISIHLVNTFIDSNDFCINKFELCLLRIN